MKPVLLETHIAFLAFTLGEYFKGSASRLQTSRRVRRARVLCGDHGHSWRAVVARAKARAGARKSTQPKAA